MYSLIIKILSAYKESKCSFVAYLKKCDCSYYIKQNTKLICLNTQIVLINNL